MKNRNINHSDHWATPKDLYDKLNLEFRFNFRFLRGRVKFVGVNTKGKRVSNNCGMHDSMIVILKKL